MTNSKMKYFKCSNSCYRPISFVTDGLKYKVFHVALTKNKSTNAVVGLNPSQCYWIRPKTVAKNLTQPYLTQSNQWIDPTHINCVLRRLAASSCCGHFDESATGLSLSPHREHGTGYRNWSCCGRPLIFVTNWKHFCSSLPMDTRNTQTGDCLWCASGLPVWSDIQMIL